MIWHPMAWAFSATAVTGGVLYFFAALFSLDVAADWAPDQFDNDQLKREHRAEISSLLARGSLYCLSAAALLGLVGVALLWHPIVPGAMCGTGVLQAMGIWGNRAMAFWGMTLTVLYVWNALDGLDRQSPQGAMIPDNARLMLTASPFLLLALIHSQKALFSVDMADPVSCCAVVYDQVLTGTIVTKMKPVLRVFALWGSLFGGIAVAGNTIVAIRLRNRRSDMMTSVMTMIWALLAAIAVKQVWSSYYYQVLSHPCSWCLFSPDYYGAGFLILGCLAVCVLESTALWAAHRAYRRHPRLSELAQYRCHKANRRILTAFLGYTVLTLLPAIHWRLSTGVWLNGNHSF